MRTVKRIIWNNETKMKMIKKKTRVNIQEYQRERKSEYNICTDQKKQEERKKLVSSLKNSVKKNYTSSIRKNK